MFENNLAVHVDLTYLESESNGDALTLDYGLGFGFDWYVSPFIGVGIAIGYNWGSEDLIGAYYPELGIVVDITKSFGVTVSQRRYFNLHQPDEDIVMLGLVFR